jgi:hypothetical protein
MLRLELDLFFRDQPVDPLEIKLDRFPGHHGGSPPWSAAGFGVFE